MITYLIKVTLIWAIFLCLYEWLFKRNASFTINRVYLFGTLAAGLIVPLIAWNTTLFKNGISGVVAINNGILNFAPAATNTPQQIGKAEQAIDWYEVIKWLYISGVVLFTVISFREIVLILRTAVYGRFTTVQGHKIFSSEKKHAPFSFMGWIFISHPEQYTEEELHYIVKHEDGHNSRKHWLDMILIQLILIIFWFHPLVWYFRYLLKLTHEYDADKIAADENVYDYGHFLLGQVLLKGTPSIAHSFHFSPIKNRITMLTNTNKRNSWKYLFAVPVLLTCTFVFARSNPSNQRVRLEHVTTYNGHRFYWEKSKVDSIQVMDPTTRETTWVVMKKQPVIHKMDDDSVYSSEFKSIRPPYFNADGNDFHEYVIGKFHAIHKTFPDSVNTITLNNIIVDQQGRVAYFDIQCSTDRGDYDISSDQGAYASYSKTVHKIIAESPDWQPATLNNRNVHCRMDGFNVYFKRTEK